MSLTDPTSGAGFAFGAKPSSAYLTTIATQQPNAIDGKVGSDISADADTAITLANGTSYRVTGTPSTNRQIELPTAGVQTGERCFFRFDCDTSTGIWRVREGAAGNFVATTASSATVDEGLIVYYDGTNWYCLLWTANITVNQ